MIEQKLTFKTAATITTKTPQRPANICPYASDEMCFPGAEYVRKCKALPQLCSCTYWNRPEVFNRCSTKMDEDWEKNVCVNVCDNP